MKRMLLGGAAIALTASTLGFAPSASASTHAAKGETWATCHAVESVKIRKGRTKDSTAIGLFPKDAKGSCEVTPWHGQMYTVCHKYNRYWHEVKYRGMRGWVPGTCLK
jgi:hypothetical protein